ncbi:MAG: Ig domain-containing protein [Oscillospiraceae bacterium]|nr:Ig domain-containing protein [Oscillospiraceae bacterium]
MKRFQKGIAVLVLTVMLCTISGSSLGDLFSWVIETSPNASAANVNEIVYDSEYYIDVDSAAYPVRDANTWKGFASGEITANIGEYIAFYGGQSFAVGNPGVANIVANESWRLVVKAAKRGASHITVTDSGKKRTITLKVVDPSDKIPLTFAGKIRINVGETTNWKSSKWVWWTSGNPGVATIDQNGNIKGLKAGTSHITATAGNGEKRTVMITVVDPNASKPLSFAGKVSIKVGQTTKWTANKWVWWTSGNPGVATIDQNGNIKALKPGVSHITGTAANGEKRTITIKVVG